MANELLNKAADYIEKNGWTKGAFQKSNGSVCVVGALRIVSGVSIHDFNIAQENPEYMAARRCLIEHLGVDITYWNDHIVGSKSKVVGTIRKVAESCE